MEMERCFCCWIFLLFFISLLELTNGCANKQFNSGTGTEHFQFTTNVPVIPELKTYSVVYNRVTTKIAAYIFNGSLSEDVAADTDVTLTGSVLAGDFSFTLSGVSTAKTGVYALIGANGTELSCVKLYFLDKPSTPVLSSGSVPEIGRSLTFTCSSSSTTVPNDHGLSLSYTWSINGSQTDPTGSRYTYNGNNLTISNVQRTDKDKPVSCTAKEGVNGVQRTSDTSNQLKVDVYYGPSSITFNPANLSYVMRSGVDLPSIICSADCHPGCSFVWYKDNTTFSSTSTLSLGRLSDNDTATYSCRASRHGNAQPTEKTLTVQVIYGPSNMSPIEGAVYTGNIAGDLSSIHCSAHCWECQYKWTGPAGVTIPGTGPNLILTNLERKHDGKYTCTATNTRSGMMDTTNVTVKVRYGPDTVTLTPSGSSHTIDEGGNLANIVCHADCYPACTFLWSKKHQVSVVTSNKTLPLGSNIRRDYAGEYTCTATNPDGYGTPKRSIVNIYVRYGPESMSLIPSKTSYSIDEGGNIGNIECKATCYPGCTYEWTKQYQSNAVSTNSILYIGDNVQRNKAGRYTCTAKNPDRANNPTSTTIVDISIRYGPESIGLTPPATTHTINEGDDIGTIECKASCYPNCTYVWRKQNQNNVESRTKILNIGNNVQRGKAGRYTCTATNPGRARRPTATATVNINVRYGPDEVILQPPQQTYTKNELETLNSIKCSADCYPSCAVKWMGNSKTYDTNILNLGNLDESEAGDYTCIATNTGKAGSARKVVTVNVRYGPKAVMFSPPVTSPLTKIEGVHQAPVSCSSNCYPKCSASWKKGTQSTSLAKDEVLSFGNVNRSYTGRFTCTSTNDATQYEKSLEKILDLVVHYSPDATITLQNASTRDISLKCLADGEPPNYDFEKWVHMAPDGKTEIQRKAGQVSGGENMLVLKNVTYMDSGVYTCKVSNNISAITSHVGKDDKEINVKDKPFVIEDGREFDAKQHGNVSISVRFYSSDSIKNITWIKIINETKTPIDSDDKYTTSITSEPVTVPFYTKNITLQGNCSKLHIQDVDVDDYADFEVHIQNSVAEEVLTLVVKPRGPPEVPRNFTILQNSETTSSIEFSWFPGFHGGADQTFYIEYKREGQGWRERASLFGGKIQNQQFQSKVDGLNSGSSYSFRIYSRNVHGNSSDKSQTLFGNTTYETVTTQSSSLIGPAVGGGLGAAVLIVLVIVGIVFVKRRLPKKSQGPTKSVLVKDDRNGGANKDSDFSEVNNPAYVSADEAVTYKANDVYAVVDKSNKQKGALTANTAAEIYTQVQKPNRGKLYKADGPSTDLYSMPVKPKGKQAKEKKQKHGKKTKGGKHKDGIQGQVNEGRSFVKQLEITQHIVLV